MDGDRSKSALARIEAALARIEAASRRGTSSSNAELAELRARHDRLRTAVQDGLLELDSLIGEAEG